MTNTLSHLNPSGEAHMVDVGHKAHTARKATARAEVQMQAATLKLIAEGGIPKGDVFATARIAGIQGAKRCADLIPLCHPLPIHHVSVDFQIDTAGSRVLIEATAGLTGQTGVEMEALTAASIAALTLYDMCKAVDKQLVVTNLRLVAKSGGRSGDWVAPELTP